jgi:hypothetical protein
MKKLIVVIVLVVLMGLLLSAAAPIPPPTQTLQGRLRWQRNSICGVSDYVSTEAMTNVYLTGKFTPTRGLLVGCQVTATGNFYRAGQCDYFNVDAYKISCPTGLQLVVDH